MKKQGVRLLLTRLEKQIIGFLMKSKGLSRYDIAKQLNGNPGTVSRIVSRLVAKQYVIEGDEKSLSVGRPRRPLSLNPAAGYIIGIDLEASNIRGVVIDFGLARIKQLTLPLRLGCKQAVTLETLAEMYKNLSTGLRGDKILGVGLGIPGLCDEERGEIISYAENYSWSGFLVKEKLARKIEHPVFAEHNIFAIALGEKWFQFQGNLKNLICIVVRAGVASAFILAGVMYRVENKMAGEISHLKIWSKGELCECGQRGCLCNYVSGKCLVEKMNNAGLGVGQKNSTLLELAKMASQGQVKAVKIVGKAGQALGIALGHIINTLGIGEVIINSDLNQAGEVFLLPIKQAIKHSVPQNKQLVPVTRFSALGGYAGSLGAAIMALQKVCDLH